MQKILDNILKSKNRLNIIFIIRVLLICLLVVVFGTMILSFTGLAQDKGNILSVGLILSFIIALLLGLSFMLMSVLANEINAHGKSISDGKLNADDMTMNKNNYFGGIAKAIDFMKANMLFLVDNTKSNVIVLSDSIDQISDGMATTCAENEEFAATIEDIASKSQEQLQDIKNIASKNEEVYLSIDEIAKRIKELERISLETNAASLSGNERLSIFDENMKLISGSISETKDFILKLKDSAGEIGKVVNFIVGVNEQLNLLSLNASIEAAKAGDAGKGFSVVASEITKLSQDTKVGVDQINGIVGKILNNSNNIEDSAQKNIQELERGNEIFSNLKDIFGNINEKNKIVLEQISDISTETSHINANMKNHTTLLQNLSISSENVSKNTMEASQAIQEQVAEYEEINSAITMLQTMLEKIQKLVNRFDTDIIPEDATPTKHLKVAIVVPSFPGVWESVKKGVLYATKTLSSKNTTVISIPMNGFSKEIIDGIKSEHKKQKFDGIAIPGIFSDALYEDFAKSGVPIINYNADTESSDRRILYVGQNSYETGRVAAEKVKEYAGNRANVLLLFCKDITLNIQLRKNGFMDYMKSKTSCTVSELNLSQFDPKNGELIKEYLKSNQNINAIYVTSSWQKDVAKVVEDLGMKGTIKVVVHDSNKDIFDNIKKGVITCTIGQDGFSQGYNPLIYLYNYLVTGQKPEAGNAWTRIEVIDKNNVRYYVD